jgi:hypothetical protein
MTRTPAYGALARRRGQSHHPPHQALTRPLLLKATMQREAWGIQIMSSSAPVFEVRLFPTNHGLSPLPSPTLLPVLLPNPHCRSNGTLPTTRMRWDTGPIWAYRTLLLSKSQESRQLLLLQLPLRPGTGPALLVHFLRGGMAMTPRSQLFPLSFPSLLSPLLDSARTKTRPKRSLCTHSLNHQCHLALISPLPAST